LSIDEDETTYRGIRSKKWKSLSCAAEEAGVNLQETLSQFKAGVLSRVSEADLAVMEQATADLINSGILRKTKKIGDRAPDFTLPDATGELVRFADLLARGPVVVTFFRGTW
jgi:hypothetical protein